MKILLVLFSFIISISTAVASEFMTVEEMLNTIPGKTLTGISNQDGETRWIQDYAEPKPGKKKGKIVGYWGESKEKYKSRWYIKKGKWCENWGSGKGCWDLVMEGNKIIAYKKGKPLENHWEFM